MSDPYERREQLFPNPRPSPGAGKARRWVSDPRSHQSPRQWRHYRNNLCSLACYGSAHCPKILRIQEHSPPLSTDVRDLK